MNVKKVISLLFIFIFSFVLKSSDGTLDTSFNPSGSVPGTVITSFSTDSTANAVAIQSDDKIIAAGSEGSPNNFTLVRYNINGSLDSSFGSGGIVSTDLGGNDSILAIKLQTDNKIVVGGFTSNGVTSLALARYNSDGSLDTTFNPLGSQPGTIITSIGTFSQILALDIQTDGKIVVGGFTNVNGPFDFLIARYNSNGTLDTTTFNPGGPIPGVVVSNFGGTNNFIRGLKIQTNGKIVVGGSTVIGGSGDFFVARYNSDGSLDTTFNAAGSIPGTNITNLGGDDAINGLALQSDGKIVVIGISNVTGMTKFATARYLSTGILDTTFNSSGSFPGTVITSFSAGADNGRAVSIQDNGKIVLSGFAQIDINDFALARYNTNGVLDPSFGNSGLVTTNFASGSNDRAFAMAIASNGKIVLAGQSFQGSLGSIASARYNNAAAFITITSPANGSSISNTQPIINGITNAGLTVTVTIKNSSNVTVFSGTVDSNVLTGVWSLPIAPTTLTEDTYTVTADIMGATTTNTFTVDTSTFITISFPINGSTINNATPTILGTSEAGNTVEVFIDSSSIGTTTATGGNWQKTTAILSEGSHTVQATATDAAGNTATTPLINFTVDSTTFIAITSPTNNSTITTTMPVITGTAEPNNTITVFIDGNSIGTTTSNGGSWSKAVTVQLSQGMHTVQATATDSQGNTATTPLITFTVDTQTFVIITNPANNSTVNNSKPLITGTSEVNNNIEIKIDNVIVGNTTTDAGGKWSFQITNSLFATNHIINVTATDLFGNVATATSNFTIDTTNFITITFPENESIITTRTPNITGTTQSGSNVQVILDGISRGTVSAVNGTWELQINTQLSNGQHTIKAISTNSSGSIATTTISFTISTSTFVTIDNPLNGSTITNLTPMIFGKTVAGNSVQISIDNVEIGIVTADINGNWTVNTPQPLSQGAHQAKAISTDSLGHTATAISNFNVDSITFVTITTIKNNQILRTNKPIIGGNAENGATVKVLIDNRLIGTVKVKQNGWVIRVKNSLTNGRHTLIAIATDAQGNTARARLTFFVQARVKQCTKGVDALTLAIRKKYSNSNIFLK